MKKLLLAGVLLLPLAACEDEHTLTQAELMTAQNGGRQYADNIGGKFLSCSGLDSDNDKYTSCEIAVGNATKKLVCSYENGAAGCKSK